MSLIVYELAGVILTHASAFLLGAFIGAAGHYLGEKYTDRRRTKEGEHYLRTRFQGLETQMPKLFSEIRRDVRVPDNRFIREFILLLRRGSKYNSSKPVFVYYEEEHEDLRNQIALLEADNFVEEVVVVQYTRVPRYRLTETFVKLLIEPVEG